MALHLTIEEHNSNPPSSWIVVKHGTKWALMQIGSTNPLQTFKTKHEATIAKESGFLVELYEKEGRWLSGEHVQGWKDHAECVAQKK